MQIKYPHKGIMTLSQYALRHLNEEKPQEFSDQRVTHWELLRQSGVSEEICQEITGISRSTYYRHK